MNIKIVIFFFLAFIECTFAETVKVGNKTLECQKLSSSSLHLKCGQAIVAHVDGNYFYLNKDSSNNLIYKAVTQIKKSNLSIYELSDEKATQVNAVLTNVNKDFYEAFQYEFYFRDILEQIDHPIAKSLAISFAENLKKYEVPSTVKLNVAGKALSCIENKVKPLTLDQKEFEIRNDFKIRCPLYSCQNEAGEKSVLFLPNVKSAEAPYFFNISKGSEGFSDKEIEVKSATQDRMIHAKKRATTQQSTEVKMNTNKGDNLTEDAFYSKKLMPWKELVKFFSLAENKRKLEEYRKICDSSELEEYLNNSVKLSERFREELSKEDLEHLIMVVNNILYGVFIPKEKATDLGCMHLGKLMTLNAYAHAKHLEKLNQTFLNESLSEKDVQSLFDEAKNMKDIPYGYKYDGCYARAHLLARRFESKGIKVEKIWVKGALSVPGTDVKWNFHVAPVVTIIDPETKSAKKMVIDPSLASKAVTPEEWLSLMKQNVKGKMEYTQFPFPSNAAGFERTAVAFSSSDQYKPEEPWNMKEEEKLKNMNQTLKDYLFAEKRNLKPIY